MKRTLKTILAGTALALGAMLPAKQAQSQSVSGNVEYIQSEKPEASYPRVNAFYNLPAGVKGYTFMEFYQSGNGYFGRTSIDKNLGKGFGVRGLVQHVNEGFTDVGLGASQNISLPKGSFVNLGLLPTWFGRNAENGQVSEAKVLAQYFVNIPLSKTTSISSFGDWNLINKSGHTEWGYGEVSLNKNIGKNFTVAYNPVLLNKGDAVPKIQHRIAGRINFGFGGKK